MRRDSWIGLSVKPTRTTKLQETVYQIMALLLTQRRIALSPINDLVTIFVAV